MTKAICMILALLFCAAANLRVCWTVGVGDETATGAYSLAACLRGLRAAEAAADELLERQGAPPGVTLRLRLALHPSQDARPISDFLLRHTEGVAAAEGCRADGVWLGCSPEGEDLAAALRRHIYQARPPGALTGHFASELRPEPVYTRAGRAVPAEALAARAFEAVPVIYTDGDGQLVEA